MGGGAAAAPTPMVVRAALKAKPPVPGELRLSAGAGVEFAPADGSAARVVPLAALSRCLLKGDKPLMKVEALEGSGAAGLVLAFDGLGGRDAAAEAVNALLAYRRAEQGEAPPQPSGKPKKARARVATQAELALRKAVLLRDAHLRRLHTELVQGGLVSDEAFWAASGRQAVLEAEAARAGGAAERQLRGSASAMLARDAFGTIEGGSTGQHGGRVRYRLTKDVKAQIFRERPAVRKAFVAVVPAKMSEKDFWEKFCRAEYFAKRAARTGGTAAAAAAEAARAAGPTDDPTDPEADVALFAVSDEQRDLERTRAMQRLEDTNAALNMAADAAEELPAAFGTARGGLLEPSAALTAATRPAEATDAAAGATGGMASQINRHGDVVMRGHEAALDGLADNADTAAIARAIESDENGAAHRGVSVGATHKHALEARERGDPLVQSAADVVISDLVDKPEPIVDELKFANPFKKRKLHQVGASEVASGRPAAVERAAKGGSALNGAGGRGAHMRACEWSGAPLLTLAHVCGPRTRI